MVDYEKKSLVLEMKLDSYARRLSWLNFKSNAEHVPLSDLEIAEIDDLRALESSFLTGEFNSLETGEIYKGFDLWNEAKKLNYSYYKRNGRLSSHISSMLKMGDCLFLTLTFTDTVLQKTSSDTRRQYVRKFLKSYSDYYVANIDFGKKNGREHYHAVIFTDKVSNSDWKFGAINFERIVVQEGSNKKLAKYVNKLTNHAIKETCKGNRIIYSKNG